MTTYTFSELFTFTRSTTATFVGSNGLIQTAAINAPRFDYDPATLQPKGILIEEQRVNLFTYSEDFTNAAWVVNGSPVITANQVTAPDGTMTADTMAVSGSSNGFGVYRNVVSSGTYTSSIYFKLMSGSFSLRLGLTSNFSVINCSTLAITNTGTGVGSVSAAGNGWYRFVSVGTISALSASELYNIGSNTGTLAIWGAQLEAGSFATSYIPTVASQVTRAADSCLITAPLFAPWYNQSEGTFVATLDTSVFLASSLVTVYSVLSANDQTSDNSMDMYAYSNFMGFTVRTGGVLQADASGGGSPANNAVIKIASAYALNNIASSINGAAPATDSSATIPTANQFSVGMRNTGGRSPINGHIRSIQYYPFRASNNQLQALTT